MRCAWLHTSQNILNNTESRLGCYNNKGRLTAKIAPKCCISAILKLLLQWKSKKTHMDYIISAWSGSQLATLAPPQTLSLVLRFDVDWFKRFHLLKLKSLSLFDRQTALYPFQMADAVEVCPEMHWSLHTSSQTLVSWRLFICLFGPGWSQIGSCLILNPGLSHSPVKMWEEITFYLGLTSA